MMDLCIVTYIEQNRLSKKKKKTIGQGLSSTHRLLIGWKKI